MKDKRKLQRRNFIYDIEVQDRSRKNEETGDFLVLGELADITVEGVMLVTDDPVAETTRFPLRILLPEAVNGLTFIDFEAESIRCSKTIHETIFTTGFRVIRMDEATQAVVERFIEEFAV